MAAGLVTACNAPESQLRSDLRPLFSCLRPQNPELEWFTIGLLSFCYVSLARTALKRRYQAHAKYQRDRLPHLWHTLYISV